MLKRLMISVLAFTCYVGSTHADCSLEAAVVPIEQQAGEVAQALEQDASWTALEILGDGIKHAAISALMGAAISGSLGALSRITTDHARDEAKQAAIYGALHGALEGLIVALTARSGNNPNVLLDGDLIKIHLGHHISSNISHFLYGLFFEKDYSFSSGVMAPAIEIVWAHMDVRDKIWFKMRKREAVQADDEKEQSVLAQ